jgi:alpha-beta hydrolase superfamily lysophospholipase
MDDARATAVAPTVACEMQPIAFDGRLGWLHMPLGPVAGAGVVLVPGIGREARCAHMPMRLLADQFAAAGFPTLRYDHLGSGDSLDLPDESGDALVDWLAGVDRAVEVLRASAGVDRIVLGGARFGASLAAICRTRADGLLLLSPVLNGRSWLRRMQFFSGVGENAGGPGQGEALDVDGLWLSPATSAGVATVDLGKVPAPRIPVFVASPNQLVNAYASRLSKAGAAVTITDFPGHKEFLLEPAINLAPDQVFERARAWMLETFGARALAGQAQGRPAEEPVLRPPGAVERCVIVADGLRGVLCEPERPLADSTAVIFCNTGGEPRAGLGGFATAAARRLAQEGVASLRFDFSGLGDSPMPGDEVRCHVFETPREAEMDAAVDFVAQRGYGEIVVVGVCSGAYHALRVGWRNSRVAGVYAVSPLKIVWRPGDTISFARKVEAKMLLDPSAWRAAREKGVSAGAILLSLINGFVNRRFGKVRRRGEASPLAEMERFAKRGGRALLVMGVGDTSEEEVAMYFGRGGAKLSRFDSIAVQVIPTLDHGLSVRASRVIAIDLLSNWLAATRKDVAA